jgi:branched-chain amino acid transport system substrate-binding protein
MVQALQVWVRSINEKGGVNGHHITLIVYDDGGDPARHRAQIREAVEQRHVMAFVMNGEAATGESSLDYITAKRVPVVGVTLAEAWAYKSPMYFPQGSAGDSVLWALVMSPRPLLQEGKRKLGWLVCVEAASCDRMDKLYAAGAARLGYEVVYRGKASVAQPDYTAECLSAQRAGVQFFLFGLDSASIDRVALACSRQGYHPQWLAGHAMLVDRQKQNSNLAGLWGTFPLFPYFQTGTPATDEYRRVMTQYGGSVPLGSGSATGWAAAKLFEKAAAHLPEPPTSQALLDGLWSIKDDTLGGLTAQPLTFQREQPATPRSCWFNVRIVDQNWVGPDGFQRHCEDPPS